MDHKLVEVDKGCRCEVCGLSWKRGPMSDCIGVPVYAWGKWPEYLRTKKQLREEGFQVGSKLPDVAGAVFRKKSPGGVMWLYDVRRAVRRAAPTPGQVGALERARVQSARVDLHCQFCGDFIERVTQKRAGEYGARWCVRCCDKARAIRTAREVLALSPVVLDTETTRLYKAEVVEVAAIDSAGVVLVNRRSCPTIEPEPGAVRVNGLSLEVLKDEPPFWEVYGEVARAVQGRVVVTYNAGFDMEALDYTCQTWNLPLLSALAQWVDLMALYAEYCGQWSEKYHDYRFQPLPGGDHSALGDARAALEVLRGMAADSRFEGVDHES